MTAPHFGQHNAQPLVTVSSLPSAVGVRCCSRVVQAAAGAMYLVVVVGVERRVAGYERLEASKGC